MIPTIILDVVNGIFGNLIGIGRDYLAGKRQEKQAVLETTLAIEKAKVESLAKITEGQALHEIDWEKTMAKSSETSWKDEYVTIVISLPFLAAFFNHGEAAARAFQAMREAPEWYTYTFIAVFLAAIGIRITERVTNMFTSKDTKEGEKK